MQIGGTALSVMGLALLVQRIKWLVTLRRPARETIARMDDPTVHIDLDEAGFAKRSDLGTTPIQWNLVTRQRGVSGFRVNWAGQPIVAAIPLTAITPEAQRLFGRAGTV